MPNYMLQDIRGTLLAFALYTLIMMVPGYVIGWFTNIFNFRKRIAIVQYLIGIVLSNIISPILMFLCARFVSISFAIAISLALLVIWMGILWIQIKSRQLSAMGWQSLDKYHKAALITGIAWVSFSILRLVDIQIGQHLYFSVTAADLTTRVSVVDAVTRTGVPPINPGYFPGHPVPLAFLYYFWYILGSMVDAMGGTWVTPYNTMVASTAWAGIIAVATTAMYIRLRDNPSQDNPRKLSGIAAQLYLISGLDFIPIISELLLLWLTFGKIVTNGQIEGWNSPIISWMNAIAWVPHHAAATFACITAMLIFLEAIKGKIHPVMATILAGLAFASATGLSVWVPLVFAIFWGIWILVLLFKKDTLKTAIAMVLSGLIALIAISPFIIGLFHSGGLGSGNGHPIEFYVRPFIASIFFHFKSKLDLYIFNFLALPLNYLFELGFCFLTAILWIRSRIKAGKPWEQIYVAEALLLSVVTIFMSFFHSTVIKINDLGIRPWLLGQFVLLIWATDIIAPWLGDTFLIKLSRFKPLPDSGKYAGLFQIFFILGFLTTLLEITAVRFVPIMIDQNIIALPVDASPDTHLGERTYFARQAYDYISNHLKKNVIIQSNPYHELDRQDGLYANHQMVFADRTIYGLSQQEFNRLRDAVGQIFNIQKNVNWKTIDRVCQQNLINYIVVGDTDPLWTSVALLATQRPPIFENPYYAVFSCGI